MTTLTLKFPLGLQSEISETLKQISSKTIKVENHLITKKYIGCEDNSIELLKGVRGCETIEIIEAE